MRKLTPRVPKNFLPIASLTGGFTLIAVGCGIIGGLGVGLIVGGILACVVQAVAYS
jgi:hypothetical protein